jgi:hypothetical protein
MKIIQIGVFILIATITTMAQSPTFEQLINFQTHQDPIYINTELVSLHWSPKFLDINRNDSDYSWAKTKDVEKINAPFSLDELTLLPIPGFSSVIIYQTPSKQLYENYRDMAQKMGMKQLDEKMNDIQVIFFVNEKVAVQMAPAPHNYTLVVMSADDYKKGFRVR